jgi:uroporphyrin-III C-methyltransferase/precorrin-2 dehydrogenase/sirohydrochlorin ferrochelatase
MTGGGFVWLVGAGPGDPELLTRRAARLLRQADLVLYDALVSPEVLRLAHKAQKFSVGKRAGRPTIRQEAIERLLVRAARRGKRVVRLKGGDPFVFGRGGEEALALAAAGVPFEVVPGVSSAVAAPALSGIPVTHRGLTSSFVVVSGHDERAYAPVLGALPPGAATVVVLMGLAARARLASFLLARGWPSSTPAAVCLAAASPRAFTWTGTLAELGAAPLPSALRDAPGTLVVGEVVTLAATLARPAAAAPSAAAALPSASEVTQLARRAL